MTPDKVWVPLPLALPIERTPVPSWITPPKSRVRLFRFRVNVAAVADEFVTRPVPLNPPIVFENPAISKIAPLDIATAGLLPKDMLDPKAAVEPAFRVPAVTVVAPV